MIEWLSPWCEADQSERDGLAAQLAKEIAVGHALDGERVILIARRTDTDDALFQLQDGRVAEVHMTWRQTRETDPLWPATSIFPSLTEWARKSMIPQHREHDAL